MARLLLSVSPQPPRVAGGGACCRIADGGILGTWVPLRLHFALASISQRGSVFFPSLQALEQQQDYCAPERILLGTIPAGEVVSTQKSVGQGGVA